MSDKDQPTFNRRNILLSGTALVAATVATDAFAQAQKSAPAPGTPGATTAPLGRKPNILVIFGDDVGQTNVSAYSFGVMGYKTPNIDRIAREGMMFTDYYAEQSCTAGRSSFITGQCTLRTGLSKVAMPGATIGLQPRDATVAELLKPLGYATGQFGKNHLGDRNEFLPTVHGFDEFFGSLCHLNSEEEPENRTYPRDPEFFEMFGPRGVLKCKATDRDDPTEQPRWGRVGKQTVEDTGQLTASVPTILQTVRAVGGFLDRAAKHCAETGADPDDFVQARLFDDMAPFHFQIEAAWHHSVWGAGGREDRRVRPARLGRSGPLRQPAGHDGPRGNGAGGVHPRRGQRLGRQGSGPSNRPAKACLHAGDIHPFVRAAQLPFPRRHRLRDPAHAGCTARKTRLRGTVTHQTGLGHRRMKRTRCAHR
jgi:Sulfatase/Domain of unknown function (DUF1993)